MFLEIAIGAIGIGIVLMVGFIIIAQVKGSLPTPLVANPCLGVPDDNETGFPDCYGQDNSSANINDSVFTDGVSATQSTIFAGFGLVAIGIIVLAAFGLISVFK